MKVYVYTDLYYGISVYKQKKTALHMVERFGGQVTECEVHDEKADKPIEGKPRNNVIAFPVKKRLQHE